MTLPCFAEDASAGGLGIVIAGENGWDVTEDAGISGAAPGVVEQR